MSDVPTKQSAERRVYHPDFLHTTSLDEAINELAAVHSEIKESFRTLAYWSPTEWAKGEQEAFLERLSTLQARQYKLIGEIGRLRDNPNGRRSGAGGCSRA